MNLAPSNRVTPWVLRLIIANAVVLLLMRTVLTSPELMTMWETELTGMRERIRAMRKALVDKLGQHVASRSRGKQK